MWLNNNSFSSNYPFLELIEYTNNQIVVIVQPASLFSK
ncbi:hypothetical protein KPLM21_390010 [Klebsiella pneumoniae]|nr:hypothetical protein KPLM21_390010 [Klebsiella pneumoniae]